MSFQLRDKSYPPMRTRLAICRAFAGMHIGTNGRTGYVQALFSHDRAAGAFLGLSGYKPSERQGSVTFSTQDPVNSQEFIPTPQIPSIDGVDHRNIDVTFVGIYQNGVDPFQHSFTL